MNPITSFVVTLGFPVAVAIGGYWFSRINTDLEKLKEDNSAKSAKIAVLDSSVAMIMMSTANIERKVDKLLEESRVRR